jgi:hypothetical protein
MQNMATSRMYPVVRAALSVALVSWFMVLRFSGWFVGQIYGGFFFCDYYSQFFMNLFLSALHPNEYKILIFAINTPESV